MNPACDNHKKRDYGKQSQSDCNDCFIRTFEDRASFFFFAALLFWGVLFAIELAKTMKEAGRYAFAVTNTSSFECFGPFLAMNVTFFDGTGALREGRSRFLFGARDVEAWQNVPLEVAYVKTAGERAEKKRAGNRKRKPDVQADAKIVVIGAAPLSKDCRFGK